MSCIPITRLCSPNSIPIVTSPDSSSDSLIVERPPNATAAASSCICVTMSNRTAAKSSGSEHLGKHVHLTNCIHLRNRFHVQKHKMMVEGRHPTAAGGLPLMRELTALSRTRSLRDPSASTVLKSPLKGAPTRKPDHPRRDDSAGAERSCATNSSERNRHSCNMQAFQEDFEDEGASNKAAGRTAGNAWKEEEFPASSGNSVGRPTRKQRKQGSRPLQDENLRKGNRHPSNMSRMVMMHLHQQQQQQQQQQKQQQQKQQQQQAVYTSQSHCSLSPSIYDDPSILGMKFPPPHLRRTGDNPYESDPEASADDEGEDEDVEEEERKLNVRSRSHSPLLSRDLSSKSRSPVPSRESKGFSFPDPAQQQHKYERHLSGHEEEAEGTREANKHGCGIPWNWSRLGNKQKGRSFLDIAGRSLSCGHQDGSMKRKAGEQVLSRSQSGSGREMIATMPECLSYSSGANSDAEVLPLLTEPESGDVAASSVEVDSDNALLREYNARRKLGLRARPQAAAEIIQSRLKERLGWINNLADRRLHDEVETRQHRSMSHKYRPRSFRDMVGQHVVVQSLSNAVLRGKIVSAYLLQGPRGTGKSSAARIFAAALNCLSSEELRPCGLCRECVALNLGKSMDVREFDASRLGGIDGVKHLLGTAVSPPSSARYRVSIIDECHMLSAESWNLLLKALEDPHGYFIFIFITSSPEQLPRSVAPRCQKYPFTKIKDADIVSRLQKMAAKENIDTEIEALELIATRSNGSLRDAETILDQLSLLGQTVTLPTVQELIGLLPDDKLMVLLDYALSGDAVNTVKSLRDLLDCGVEPLALMSQLATLITDILAGTHKLPADQKKKSFFHKNTLNKEELERLRQALKLLSEAEKQVRASSDQTTWLIAAILQFAPDRTYAFQSSSSGTSATQSLVAGINDTSEKETVDSESGKARNVWEIEDHFGSQTSAVFPKLDNGVCGTRNVAEARIHPYASCVEGDVDSAFDQKKVEEVWQKVLKRSRSKMKKLLRTHGRISSLSMQEGRPTVELEFQSLEHRAKAEKLKARLTKHFHSALGCPVTVQFTSTSKLLDNRGPHPHGSLHSRQKGSNKIVQRDGQGSPVATTRHFPDVNKNEERLETAWAREAQNMASTTWHAGEPSGVPLATAMQQAGSQHSPEVFTQFRRTKHSGPPTESTLEQENLRLECRTKSSRRRILCCWRAKSDDEKKAAQRRRRRRRVCFFLRLMPCSRSCCTR